MIPFIFIVLLKNKYFKQHLYFNLVPSNRRFQTDREELRNVFTSKKRRTPLQAESNGKKKGKKGMQYSIEPLSYCIPDEQYRGIMFLDTVWIENEITLLGVRGGPGIFNRVGGALNMAAKRSSLALARAWCCWGGMCPPEMRSEKLLKNEDPIEAIEVSVLTNGAVIETLNRPIKKSGALLLWPGFCGRRSAKNWGGGCAPGALGV